MGLRPTKRILRSWWFLTFLTLMVLYPVLGFWILPMSLKSQLLRRLPALTHRQASLDQVQLNPYTLQLRLRGLKLLESNGDPFLSWESVHANLQWSSLWNDHWILQEVLVVRPSFHVSRDAQGTLNLANLFTNRTTRSGKPLPLFLVERLRVEAGTISLNDLSHGEWKNRVLPLELTLTNLSTLPNRQSAYVFSGKGESGETFDWNGTLTISPLKSRGTLRVEGLPLHKFDVYFQDFLNASVHHGTLGFRGDYNYDGSTNLFNFHLKNAGVGVQNLLIKDAAGKETLLSLPDLVLQGVEMSVLDQIIRVEKTESAAGFLMTRVQEGGLYPWTTIRKKTDAKPTALKVSPGTTAPIQWRVDAPDIRLKDFSARWEDWMREPHVHLDLDQIQMKVQEFHTLSNATPKASLAFRVQQQGRVATQVQWTSDPFFGKAQVQVEQMPIAWGSPYLPAHLSLDLTEGVANFSGELAFALEKNKPKISFQGRSSLDRVSLQDKAEKKTITAWNQLTLEPLLFQLDPMNLQVGKVLWLEPQIWLGVDPNGELSWKKWIPSSTAAVQKSKGERGPKPTVDIQEITMQGGELQFRDDSLPVATELKITGMQLRASPIHSRDLPPIDLDMSGQWNPTATFQAKGRISPQWKKEGGEMVITVKNGELTSLTGYAEKFAGYTLEKGKSQVELKYSIADQELKGENKLLLEQLNFGRKVEITHATTLPVKFAVALLKDRKGNIELDLPVRGRLDDPKFKMRSVVLGVFRNLLEKAATSPFSLIGAMFGGGGEELSYVDFESGTDAVRKGEDKKLETLSRALANRPGLSLEIQGFADPLSDKETLLQAKLSRELKAIYMQKLRDSGQDPAAVAAPDLKRGSAEYSVAITDLYLKKFAPETVGPLEVQAELPAKTPINKGPAQEIQPPTTAPPVASPELKPTAPGSPLPLPRKTPVDTRQKNSRPRIQAKPKGAVAQTTRDNESAPGERGSPPSTPEQNLRPEEKTSPNTFKPGIVARPPIILSPTPQVTTSAPAPLSDRDGFSVIAPSTPVVLTWQQMEKRLLEFLVVTGDDFKLLAEQRAQLVQQFLLKREIEPSRIFLKAPGTMDLKGKGEPRVRMSLN